MRKLTAALSILLLGVAAACNGDDEEMDMDEGMDMPAAEAPMADTMMADTMMMDTMMMDTAADTIPE